MITPSKIEISIVIPTQNDGQLLEKVLNGINDQTLLPTIIVIVDSSTNENIKEFCEEYKGIVSIIYHREKNTYPGKARNIGAQISSGTWIGFLDSKTVPEKDWLERYFSLIKAYHSDVIFGYTQFEATLHFQKTLRAATYGQIGHHTVPGTLIKKKVFIDSGEFLEHVRMGEDIEWRDRLMKNGFKIHKPQKPVVSYTGLPINFYSTLKKYLISAYHTSRLNILRNMKDAYLTMLLILSAIILPKWNHLIGGWDANPLFIPHVTKVYLIALVFLFLSYQLVRHIFFRNISWTLFSRTLQLIMFFFITLSVYRWNSVIADWMEDAILYVPHITKMYIGVIILASTLYRGILLPLKRNVETSFLFPFRWLQVGLLGLCLDLIKAPGYVVGAVIAIFKK